MNKIYVLISLLLAGICFGTEINVPDDYSTIQAGINAASSGDTINIAAGTYVENITLKDGVIIVGAGADVCVIDGNAAGSVITYNTGDIAQIKNFTITNGYASNGGGIYVDNSSRLLIYNCTITENVATNGGGVFNTNTSIVNINNCNVTYNRADNGGAVYNGYHSYTTYQYSTVSGNSPTQIVGFSEAHDYGGNTFGNPARYVDDNGPANYTSIQPAIDASADGDMVIVLPGTYVGNINMLGKAITLRSSDPTNPEIIASTIIDGNQSGNGIVCVSGEDPNTVITGFAIVNGSGAWIAYGSEMSYVGGGICISHCSPTISHCTFTSNTAYYGGGIFTWNSSPTINNCTFTSNTAYYGGGIMSQYSSCTITNCDFIENKGSTLGGGGIYGFMSSLSVTNCTFENNVAEGMNPYGGGLRAQNSSITITDCIFSNNTASRGGGMRIDSFSDTCFVVDCIFKCNTASDYGGGLAICSNSSSLVSGCIFSCNTAEVKGGALYVSNNVPKIEDCIFTANTAGEYGGAIQNYSADISGCLFAGNIAGNMGGGINNYSEHSIFGCSFCINSPENISGSYIDKGNNAWQSCTKPAGIKGDLDGDGDVDMIDFAAFAENWLIGTD